MTKLSVTATERKKTAGVKTETDGDYKIEFPRQSPSMLRFPRLRFPGSVMQCVLWSLLVAIVVTILVMVSGYPAPGSSSVEMNMDTKPLSSEQTEGQPKDSGGDVCSLPSETGMCRGYFPRFFYNSADGECQKFIYGGCDGNANNFETLEACKAACQK